jgi:hypothetical protein
MLANWVVLPEYILLGSLGAASLEWLKSYELKGKKNADEFKAIVSSKMYWIKFALFILASGFIAWAMNENNPNSTVWQIVVAGMSANALANKGIEATLAREQLHAGGESKKVEFRDLF